MSMYCTLPRGHSQASQCSRASWAPSDNAAANFVDDLFDPILNDACNQLDSLTFRPQSAVATLPSPCGSDMSEQNSLVSITTSRGGRAASELNLSEQRVSAARLYFAVDNFEDLKAIRRSSAVFTEAAYQPLPAITSQASLASSEQAESPTSGHYESLPNFYGDVASVTSASDSAYESSSESLRGTSNHNATTSIRNPPRTFAEYKKSVSSNSTTSKYFTLPSRLGRKLKKQFAESIAPSGQVTSSTSASSSTNGGAAVSDRQRSASMQLNLTHLQSSGAGEFNDTPGRHPIATSTHPQPAANQSTLPAPPNNTSHSTHCCCKSGCHVNSAITVHCCDSGLMPNAQSARKNGQTGLETLWEESGPAASEVSGAGSYTLFSSFICYS